MNKNYLALVALSLSLCLLQACLADRKQPDLKLKASAEVAQNIRPAPKTTGVTHDGTKLDFADLYSQGPVLVYFYPKADTPGCTAQSCSLRDSYEALTDAGVQVVGVSADSVEKQKAFRDKYQLPFTLVADPEGAVMKSFGVPTTMGLASRQAFLIKDGSIVWHDKSASTKKQAEDVLVQVASW